MIELDLAPSSNGSSSGHDDVVRAGYSHSEPTVAASTNLSENAASRPSSTHERISEADLQLFLAEIDAIAPLSAAVGASQPAPSPPSSSSESSQLGSVAFLQPAEIDAGMRRMIAALGAAVAKIDPSLVDAVVGACSDPSVDALATTHPLVRVAVMACSLGRAQAAATSNPRTQAFHERAFEALTELGLTEAGQQSPSSSEATVQHGSQSARVAAATGASNDRALGGEVSQQQQRQAATDGDKVGQKCAVESRSDSGSLTSSSPPPPPPPNEYGRSLVVMLQGVHVPNTSDAVIGYFSASNAASASSGGASTNQTTVDAGPSSKAIARLARKCCEGPAAIGSVWARTVAVKLPAPPTAASASSPSASLGGAINGDDAMSGSGGGGGGLVGYASSDDEENSDEEDSHRMPTAKRRKIACDGADAIVMVDAPAVLLTFVTPAAAADAYQRLIGRSPSQTVNDTKVEVAESSSASDLSESAISPANQSAPALVLAPEAFQWLPLLPATSLGLSSLFITGGQLRYAEAAEVAAALGECAGCAFRPYVF